MSTAVLSNGVHRLEIEIDEDCSTLRQVLDFYRDQINIPSDASVTVNDEVVDDDYEISPDDEIVAVKRTGSKG